MRHLLLIAASLLMAGAAQAQRVLTIGAQTPPSALDPHYHNTQQNSQIGRLVFEPLCDAQVFSRVEVRK